MPAFFIGNPTAQYHDFYYISPTTGRQKYVTIPPFGQAQIEDSTLTTFGAAAIVAPHVALYGMTQDGATSLYVIGKRK